LGRERNNLDLKKSPRLFGFARVERVPRQHVRKRRRAVLDGDRTDGGDGLKGRGPAHSLHRRPADRFSQCWTSCIGGT
jgi:hypothetical protein